MANTKITNPELFNLGDSTLATQLPVVTFAERDAMSTPSVGETIFNSDTDKVEYWDGNKWYGITYYQEPQFTLAFNEMWYSVDSPYNCSNNRAFINNNEAGIWLSRADFNTYTEGQADVNASPRTSGKWYIEIENVGSSGNGGVTIFQKSGNTIYNTPPYVSSNPVDGQYGITCYGNSGTIYRDGVNIGSIGGNFSSGRSWAIAVDLDNQKVWFGARDGTNATPFWGSGNNPATGAGGYDYAYTEYSLMVSHASETSSRYSEFAIINPIYYYDLTASGFQNWYGTQEPTLTINCSTH